MGRLAAESEIVSPDLFAVFKRGSIAGANPLGILVKTLRLADEREVVEVNRGCAATLHHVVNAKAVEACAVWLVAGHAENGLSGWVGEVAHMEALLAERVLVPFAFARFARFAYALGCTYCHPFIMVKSLGKCQ